MEGLAVDQSKLRIYCLLMLLYVPSLSSAVLVPVGVGIKSIGGSIPYFTLWILTIAVQREVVQVFYVSEAERRVIFGITPRRSRRSVRLLRSIRTST